MSKKSYTPNDHRSIVKNPTSPAYAADRSNRIQQGPKNVPPPQPPGSSERDGKKTNKET